MNAMTAQLLVALATLSNNWKLYALVLTMLVGILGVFGHGFTALGNLCLRSQLAPVRALGHTLVLVGGLLTGLYSHWGAVAATITQFVAALASVLPKGPGASGGAAVTNVGSGSARGSISGPPEGGMACAALACALLLTGCGMTAGQLGKDVASVAQASGLASQYLSDAGNWLSFVEGLLEPLPESAAKSELGATVEQGRVDLLDLSKLTAKGGLTLEQLDAAYKDFRATAGIVAALAQQLGLPGGGALRSHAAGAPQPAPAPFPLPLCVTNFKGSAQ
jgi:hypothetical protein